MEPSVGTTTANRNAVVTEVARRRAGARDEPAPARILVVDRSLLTAEALVVALTQKGTDARFLASVTTNRLREQIRSWRPDVALVDVDTPSGEVCVELAAILRDAGVPVVVTGSRLDVLAACVTAGASYAVDKGLTVAALVEVIGHIVGNGYSNEVVLHERFSSVLQSEMRARSERLGPFNVLTWRERHILGDLVDGRSAEDIARRDSVSILTVRSQIKAILQKLGVNSQLSAAALARQVGWSFSASDAARPRRPAR